MIVSSSILGSIVLDLDFLSSDSFVIDSFHVLFNCIEEHNECIGRLIATKFKFLVVLVLLCVLIIGLGWHGSTLLIMNAAHFVPKARTTVTFSGFSFVRKC